MSKHSLFDAIKLGAFQLKNRFVVSPLTRIRADADTFVPNDLLTEYYSQRAGFGLILTECSQVSTLSNAIHFNGAIYSQEQVHGWKKVTDAVHKKNGQIALQIWHCGRAAMTSALNGQSPVAPSPIAISELAPYSNDKYPIPRELTIPEIKEIVAQFKQGAINAKAAGFDGLQLHGANGYLVDQFLKESTNHRKDIYGGSVENRSRFALEVIDALVDVFGSDRVSIRLSPTGRFNDIYDSNPLALMSYLLPELDKRNLAFVEVRRHSPSEVKPTDNIRTSAAEQIPDFYPTIRKLFKSNLIANDSISIEEATQLIEGGIAQAVSFGQKSIANPDLPYRIKNNLPLNQPDQATFYSRGPKGYTDYPILEQTKP